MLEPDAGKLARPVLRGGSGGNAAPLPDRLGFVAAMTFHQFQDFVAANIDWFHGRLPETDSSLQQVEGRAGP